jgi:hypothetical protein
MTNSILTDLLNETRNQTKKLTALNSKLKKGLIDDDVDKVAYLDKILFTIANKAASVMTLGSAYNFLGAGEMDAVPVLEMDVVGAFSRVLREPTRDAELVGVGRSTVYSSDDDSTDWSLVDPNEGHVQPPEL